MRRENSEGETPRGGGAEPKKDGNGPSLLASQKKYMKYYKPKEAAKYPLALSRKSRTGRKEEGGEPQKSEADATNQDPGARATNEEKDMASSGGQKSRGLIGQGL